MRAGAALLAALLAAASGCSDRPRTNPFDPGNPATGGRPAGFVAIGEEDQVRLRWRPAADAGNVSFQLYRRAAGEIGFKPLGPLLPAARAAFTDSTAVSGTRYDYRLYYVLGGARSGVPAEDYAIPGPLRVWFTDLDARTLNRLSSDGHRVAATVTGFHGPTALGFDPVHRRVWVTDTYDGLVIAVEADGTSRLRLTGLIEPVAIAIDPARDRMWVCDQARDAVFQYRLDGGLRTPASLTAINQPIDVAHDPRDGSIWVLERADHRVRRYTGTGTPLEAFSLFAPSRVEVDSVTQDAWITSFEGSAVYRITASGTIADTILVAGPIGVAVDAARGRIWIADALLGQVLALRRSGTEEFRIAGLTAVRELSLDRATGDCWATVPGSRSVVRLSPAGAATGGAGGLGEPWGVVSER